MNFLEILCLLMLLNVFSVSGFPQSANEVATGTKLIEQVYYHNDVKKIVMTPVLLLWRLISFQAPGLIPFDNPSHIDNAKEETEGYGSKIDSVYDGFQKKTLKIFNVIFWRNFSNVIV